MALFNSTTVQNKSWGRSDGVGPDRLGGLSSSFHVHGKEGLLPVSDESRMVRQDS